MGIVKRFIFIEDENLRKEIDMNYLFIAFIKGMYDEPDSSGDKEFDEAIQFGYKKIIVLLVASIVEALLLYTIKRLEVIHDKCLGISRVQFGKSLGTLETGERLLLYKETDVKFRDDTKFSDLINILCDKFDLEFDELIRKKLTRMKILRNGVHLSSQLSSNKDYIETNIESLLGDATEITNLCKQILTQ